MRFSPAYRDPNCCCEFTLPNPKRARISSISILMSMRPEQILALHLRVSSHTVDPRLRPTGDPKSRSSLLLTYLYWEASGCRLAFCTDPNSWPSYALYSQSWPIYALFGELHLVSSMPKQKTYDGQVMRPDVSTHVTCGSNAGRRIDATFANPTSPALQPDIPQEVPWSPPVPLREQ